MLVAVLDVGSQTAHLRIVDAQAGGPLLPVFRLKVPTRLSAAIRLEGWIPPAGVDSVVAAVAEAASAVAAHDVADLAAYATAAIRDAPNGPEVRGRVRAVTGVDLQFVSGRDEAELTYLAARRWFGWGAGRLLLLDIGGGSMEIAAGSAENASFAHSVPLGVRQLTRTYLDGPLASAAQVAALHHHVRDALAPTADQVGRGSDDVRPVATSKVFKQLGRLCGLRQRDRCPPGRLLARDELRHWIPRLAAMTVDQRASLPGVSPHRAHLILAGAVIAEAAMAEFGIDQVDICPWALREGVLFHRLPPIPDPTRHAPTPVSNNGVWPAEQLPMLVRSDFPQANTSSR